MGAARKRVRGNGEGGVRHDRKRNRWVGQVTLGFTPVVDAQGQQARDAHGQPLMRQRRRSVVGRTKADVLGRMKEIAAAVDRGVEVERTDLTVADYLQDWLLRSLPGTVALPTHQQYSDVVRLYIVPRIGSKKLAKLSARDVSGMLLDMAAPTPSRPKGYSSTSRRLARSVLRRALRAAEAEGLVARNVAALANAVKADHSEGRTLTPEEATMFLQSIRGHRDEAAFVVMLSCGLRLSELLGLAWDCIELDGPTPKLQVRRGLKRVTGHGLILEDVKTKKSRRTIHLTPATATALRDHRRRSSKAKLAAGESWPQQNFGVDLVFRSPVGNPMDPKALWQSLSDATKSAGAEWEPDPGSGEPGAVRIVAGTGLGHWHPHELRHSAASLLLAQGVPLKLVSEMLGHSSIAITADIYSHLLDDARAEVARAMTAVTG